MKQLRISSSGELYEGNAPRRRNRPHVYQILKTNYNHETGSVYNTYCIQDYNSKVLIYFVEVCPVDDFEWVVGARALGKKHLNLKDCRDIIKSLLDCESEKNF